jgi:hypothetical protein
MTRRRKILAATALAVAVVVAAETPRVRARLLAAACHAQLGAACVEAARIVVNDDQRRSTALLTHGCDTLKDAGSCELLADFTGSGLAGPADYERAARMCLEGDRRFGRACLRMAFLTIAGQFGEYDRVKRTETFFARACRLGVEEGCRSLSTAASRIQEIRQLDDIAGKCVNGGDEACHRVIQKLKSASP